MRETKKEKQKSEVNYSPTITGRMKTGLAVSEDQEKWAVCDESLQELCLIMDAEQQLIQSRPGGLQKAPTRFPQRWEGESCHILTEVERVQKYCTQVKVPLHYWNFT